MLGTSTTAAYTLSASKELPIMQQKARCIYCAVRHIGFSQKQEQCVILASLRDKSSSLGPSDAWAACIPMCVLLMICNAMLLLGRGRGVL